MSLRKTLRNIASASRLLGFAARNWRTIWGLHSAVQDVKESPEFRRFETLRADIEACDECGDGHLCKDHRAELSHIEEELL